LPASYSPHTLDGDFTVDLLRIARILSALSIAMGAFAIVAPVSVADMFGLSFQQGTNIGFGEVGALYGGNFIGLGLIGLYATRESFEEGGLLIAAIGIVWLCIAGGRLLVMLTRMSEASSLMGWLSLVFEAGWGAAFVLAARSRTRLV
jgi:hypothetical protein